MSQKRLLSSCKIGIVPLNWRYTDDRKEFVTAKLSEYGFVGLQISQQQALSSVYRELFKANKLEVAELYVAIKCTPDSVLSDAEQLSKVAIDAAKAAGTEMIVFAVDGSEDRDLVAANAENGPSLTNSGYQQLARHINYWAEYSNSLGMRASFHPHAATYIETPGETRQLFKLLNENVGLCLDVGHWIVGGGDPIKAVVEYGSRITHIHVKDVDPKILARLKSKELKSMESAVSDFKLFAPAGTGALDLTALFSELENIGYQGWLMSEQDSAWEPAEEKSLLSYANITKALAC